MYTSQKDIRVKKQRVDTQVSDSKDISRKQSVQTSFSKRKDTPDSISSTTSNSKFDKLKSLVSRNRCLMNWKLNRPPSLLNKCKLISCENLSKMSDSLHSESISHPIKNMNCKKHNFNESSPNESHPPKDPKRKAQKVQQSSKNDVRYQPLSCKSNSNSNHNTKG